jgi:ribosomal protein S18 acetylase RimI-like enzyme
MWRFLRGKDGEEETGQQDEAERQLRVRVRPYNRRDRAAVLDLARTGFDGVSLDQNIERQFGKVGGSWQEHKKDAVDYDLNRNPRSVFVAEFEGEIVGFVCNRIYRARSIGHVANLAVAAGFRRRGVGKLLMAASLDHFRKQGLRYARIETLAQNVTAASFYPSLGFQEVGRQVFYFKEL